MQKYDVLAEQDRERYRQEIKTVYGTTPSYQLKPAPSAAPAAAATPATAASAGAR